MSNGAKIRGQHALSQIIASNLKDLASWSRRRNRSGKIAHQGGDAYDRASASRATSRGGARSFRSATEMGGSQIFRQGANAQTARHCRQRTTRQLQRETATFQSVLCGEKPQIRKTSEPLQFDREDLRLVDQVQLKLQRGDLVGDGAVVRFSLGNVVVRVPVLDVPVYRRRADGRLHPQLYSVRCPLHRS